MTMIQRDHLEHKYYTHTSPNDAIISTYVPFLPFPILDFHILIFLVPDTLHNHIPPYYNEHSDS